jgi:hypothetical protein
MKFGYVLSGGEDFRAVVDLAPEAEKAGWDGIFVPDGIAIETKDFPAFPMFDPWVVLGAMAAVTKRIRIGTMLTPVPRRRPWKLAKEVATLDHLSNGRAILTVGLGAAQDDGGFCKVGEPMGLKTRAQILDESLEIISGLWSGEHFTFKGEHYRVDRMKMLPRPVQAPRVPIWVVGVWNKTKSVSRTLRYDGLVPQIPGKWTVDASDIEAIRKFIDEKSLGRPFDILTGGTTPGKHAKKAAAVVRPHAKAGATWWLESNWTSSFEKTRERIRQGPPPMETFG